MGALSIVVSILSFAISATTLWLTYLRHGRLAMTAPTILFFGYDKAPKITPKIFLRTLLYSTSTQGQVVEGMYVKLRRDGVERTFSFWGYGETEKLTPGSGLFVGRTGVAANHHFVLSVHQEDTRFGPGPCEISVFARIVGRRRPLKLSAINLVLTEAHAKALARHDGVLFELGPDDAGYLAHAEPRPEARATGGRAS